MTITAEELANLSDALRGGQQCDEDGVMCIVSRQACHEAADQLERILSGQLVHVEEVEKLREALAWYEEQARLCRIIHSQGDLGRQALDADGGRLAIGGDFTGYAEQTGAGLIDYPPGFVDIYDRSQSQWLAGAVLEDPNPRSNSDRFGESLAITPDGKTLAVGMSGDQLEVPSPVLYKPRGAVHVFSHNGQWQHSAQVTSTDDDTSAQDMGRSVAIAANGREIIAGASEADGTDGNTTLTNSGRVYPLSLR